MGSQPGGTVRWFAALMLDEAVCEELGQAFRASLGLAPPRMRSYGPGDVHMTLFFLGPLAAELEERVGAALASALEGAPCPLLRLTHAGAFPRRGRERILWAGLGEEGAGELRELHTRVDRALVGLGFERDERPWAPHLTLARVRPGPRSAAVADAFHELELDLPWRPRAVALARSRAAEEGPGRAYAVERRFELGA